MSECELQTAMQKILEENQRLKYENAELKERMKLQYDWESIRTGVILPIFYKKYGTQGQNIMMNVITPIRMIVKEFLGISKMAQINQDNYEEAKSLAEDLAETFCKHDWKILRKWQDYYNGKGPSPEGR